MNNKYRNFKYFVECYFNQSMSYDDLEWLIDQYIDKESNKFVDGMKAEIAELYCMNNPQFIIDFVIAYGRRGLSVEKAEKMINLFHEKFKDI